jgi:hypothetical protein
LSASSTLSTTNSNMSRQLTSTQTSSSSSKECHRGAK